MSRHRYHFILDARCDANEHLLCDKEALALVITDLARLCEMKILLGPTVVEGTTHNPGLTGFAIIDYSHISIHTFANTNDISVDIFSCRPFDSALLLSYLLDAFHLHSCRVLIGVPVLHHLRIDDSQPLGHGHPSSARGAEGKVHSWPDQMIMKSVKGGSDAQRPS